MVDVSAHCVGWLALTTHVETESRMRRGGLAMWRWKAPGGGRRAARSGRARPRYRFRRSHKPHFYLGTSALVLALLLCVADLAALVHPSTATGELAFVVLIATLVAMLGSYFLGFFMVMDGNIPLHRIKVFLPHALVGSLSPLLYMLNFTIALDGAGRRPLALVSMLFAFVSAAAIGAQYLLGRRVTRVEGLRVVRATDVA